MASSDKRKAIRAAQTLLSIQSPNIVVDGVWGPKSEAALAGAKGEVKQVASTVKVFSDTIKAEQKNDQPGVWVTRAEAMRLIDNAATVAKVPAEWLVFMLDMEPEKRYGPLGVEYRADSVSPGKSYFGLMQVGRAAWADAKAKFPFIGEFEKNKFDPALNVMAAAGYALANVGYARSIHGYQGEFSAELIYAMHNQGHTYLSSVKNGGKGRYYNGQSSKAKLVLGEVASTIRPTLS